MNIENQTHLEDSLVEQWGKIMQIRKECKNGLMDYKTSLKLYDSIMLEIESVNIRSSLFAVTRDPFYLNAGPYLRKNKPKT